MQAIARWGNYFNQELYGPPTTLPWGIPIDCAHRIADYPCDQFPLETTRFHPLFLYESLSGVARLPRPASGSATTARPRLRPGDLLLVFFIWYGDRPLRARDAARMTTGRSSGSRWPSSCRSAFIIGSIAVLLYRHRPDSPPDAPPTSAGRGDLGRARLGRRGNEDWRSRPVDEPWANVGG